MDKILKQKKKSEKILSIILLKLEVGFNYTPFMILQKYKFKDNWNQALNYVVSKYFGEKNQYIRVGITYYKVIKSTDRYGIDRDKLLVKLNEVGIQSRPLWGLISDQKPFADNEAYRIENV